MSNDPLGLTRAMRTAYDFIKKNGHATGVHREVAEYTAKALADRGLIELLWVPTGYREVKAWIAIPLGGKKPRKYELPETPVARPFSVSGALGRGKNADGSKLVRSERIKTPKGEKRTGGYCVNASGTEGLVIVTWTTPDDMPLTQALETRPRMLKIYTEILRKADFVVKEDSDAGVLYVSR